MKSLYIYGSVAIGVIALLTFNSISKPPKYHPSLGAIILDKETWRASKKFKDLGDCNASGNLDDMSIDWKKLSNYGVANACLFYLFEKMDGPKEAANWLESEGFTTSEPYQYRAGKTTMQQFGYDPLKKVTVISASWRLKGQAKKFAVAGQKNNIAYSQSIGVGWFPDGKLKSVKTLSIIN